jgi:hypothetical protein
MFCVGLAVRLATPAAGCVSAPPGSRPGKGQAKSPLMAAIGLYMMGYYGDPARQGLSPSGRTRRRRTSCSRTPRRCAGRRSPVPTRGRHLEPRRGGHPGRRRQRLQDRAPGHQLGFPVAGERRGDLRSAPHAGERGRDPRIQARQFLDRDLAARDRQDAGRRADAAGDEHAGVDADGRHPVF